MIVIPAGLPRKPGMTRNDLLSKNAGIIQELFRSIACQCPKALVAIITNPVNAMVPIASLVMQEVQLVKIVDEMVSIVFSFSDG